MAESTNPTSSQSTSSSTPSTPAKGKLTILSSAEDGVAQPDSFRGSEEHLKDLEVEDLEEQRRETQRKLSEKK